MTRQPSSSCSKRHAGALEPAVARASARTWPLLSLTVENLCAALRQLAAQNAKVEGLKAQQANGQTQSSVAPQAAPGETEAMLQLKLQLMQQQQEIAALKAAQ